MFVNEDGLINTYRDGMPSVFDGVSIHDVDRDGYLRVIEKFRSDPRALLDTLGCWLSVKSTLDLYLSFGMRPRETEKEQIKLDFQLFSVIKDCIVLWCDSELRSISPVPIIKLHSFYEIEVFLPLCGASTEDVQANRKLEFPDMPGEDVREMVRTHAGPLFLEAISSIERVRSVALLEYHRLLARQPPEAEDLVSADDVAAILCMAKKSLDKYRKDWPDPEIPGSGQRPDQWIYARLKPTLSRQFSRRDLPDTPNGKARNKGAAPAS